MGKLEFQIPGVGRNSQTILWSLNRLLGPCKGNWLFIAENQEFQIPGSPGKGEAFSWGGWKSPNYRVTRCNCKTCLCIYRYRYSFSPQTIGSHDATPPILNTLMGKLLRFSPQTIGSRDATVLSRLCRSSTWCACFSPQTIGSRDKTHPKKA